MEPSDLVAEALRDGKRAALVRVTGIEGEPPSRVGLCLAVCDDGTVAGTLGCDGFDRAGARDALLALERREPITARYDWDERSRIAVEARAFAPGDTPPERAAPPPELLVVGSGPVARALADLGAKLGFEARVIEGPDLAPVRAARTDADTYVVICGHDEEFSQPALRALVRGEARYLGMMGSRRHTGHLLEDLRAEGVAGERLARVHSPVGLDIGAQTPEEIALSALAHIVATRRGRPGTPLA